MDADQPDSEVPLCVRDVQFLSCEAVYADRPDDGVPGALIVLACRNEIEQPLLLSVDDSRRLLLGLLDALAFHDDSDAEWCAMEYRRRKQDATATAKPSRPVAPEPVSQVGSIDTPILWGGHKNPPPTTGGLRSLRIKLLVHWPTETKPVSYRVFGAYQNERGVYVLHRFPRTATTAPGETICRIADGYLQVGLAIDEYLPLEDWRRFGELPPGAEFKIGGTVYRKMAPNEMRRLIKGRIIPVKYPQPEPTRGRRFSK